MRPLPKRYDDNDSEDNDDDGSSSSSSESSSESDLDEREAGTMARFVPTLVLERLRTVGEAAMAKKMAGPGPAGGVEHVSAISVDDGAIVPEVSLPQVHELDAAVMVVDVSGFSGMCERFAQGRTPDGGWRGRTKGIPSQSSSACGSGSTSCRRSGASHASMITSMYRLSNEKETKGFGAEGVRDALNLTLGALISTVERHGGDVLRIAGDALIVLFHQGQATIAPHELTDLCLACTRCGWECATSAGVGRTAGGRAGGGSGGMSAGSGGVGGLSVHVGVGCGRVSCFHVGSDQMGWQLVVSGDLFEEQVAEALNASKAGQVVVSAEVWQRLAGTGWGSAPVSDPPKTQPRGLRLLKWTPDPGGVSGEGYCDDGPASAGGGAPAVTAPTHAGGGALATPPPPSRGVSRRASLSGPGSGAGWAGPAAGASSVSSAAALAGREAAGGGGTSTGGVGLRGSLGHGRAASLDHVGGSTGAVRPGGRWCPSRRRKALLEEVETGMLTMLSKDVGKALAGYCPQPIREGLVAERLGLLAELQRVAVLFVGLCFERLGIKTPSAAGTRGRKTLDTPDCSINSISRNRLRGGDTAQLPTVGAGRGDRAESALAVLQESFSLLQSIVHAHGGVIKELSVDDKGTVLVVGFGLSPHVGHLPAARATLCAMESTDRLRSLGLARCHAGVATGPVFCGSLGSDDRREYAMVSETVNLAQRLMSARKDRRLVSKAQHPWNGASGGSEDMWEKPFNPWVVLESETLREARKTNQLEFLELEAIKVKGKSCKLPVFAPGLASDRPVSPPSSTGGGQEARAPAGNSGGGVLSGAPSSLELDIDVSDSIPGLHVSGQMLYMNLSGGGDDDDLEYDGGRGSRGGVSMAAMDGGGRAKPAMKLSTSLPSSLDSTLMAAATADGADIPPFLRNSDSVDGGATAAGVSDSHTKEIDHRRYLLKMPSKSCWESGGGGGEAGVSGGPGRRLSCQVGSDGGWGGAGERRGRGRPISRSRRKSLDGGLHEPFLMRSYSEPADVERADPHPETAARRLASWRKMAMGGGGSGYGMHQVGRGGVGEGGGGGSGGGDALSREAFEALLPCIFHADAVHDEVSHILWARTGGRVSYLADLCRSLVGVEKRAAGGSSGGGSFGDVGEDGTWRLRLNEFAHVLKLASRVPVGVEGALQQRLDELPYTARQVVLRAMCVCLVGGVGETDLLLHLLTNVAPFKEYWAAVVAQHLSPVPTRRRRRRDSNSVPPRRAKGGPRSSRASTASPACSSGKGSSPQGGGGDAGAEGDVGDDVEEDRSRAQSEVVRPSEPEGGRESIPEEASRTPQPAGPGSARSALRAVLSMLEAGGFLRVCGDGNKIICDDLMLIDQVYASTPFKLRKGLHKEAAKWLSDRHRKSFRDRAGIMPVLISHLTQAHEEARAQAMLAVLKVLGGRFLDRWVLEHVRPLVSIRDNPKNPTASEHLALCVLPAIPSLRGLSKAIRGAEIAGVVVGVALRLRSLRFKDMDKMAVPRHRRSVSVSVGALKDAGNKTTSSTSRQRTRLDRVSLGAGGIATVVRGSNPPRGGGVLVKARSSTLVDIAPAHSAPAEICAFEVGNSKSNPAILGSEKCSGGNCGAGYHPGGIQSTDGVGKSRRGAVALGVSDLPASNSGPPLSPPLVSRRSC